MDVKTTGSRFGRKHGSHMILKVLSHRLLINYKKEKEKSWQWGNLVATNREIKLSTTSNGTSIM